MTFAEMAALIRRDPFIRRWAHDAMDPELALLTPAQVLGLQRSTAAFVLWRLSDLAGAQDQQTPVSLAWEIWQAKTIIWEPGLIEQAIDSEGPLNPWSSAPAFWFFQDSPFQIRGHAEQGDDLCLLNALFLYPTNEGLACFLFEAQIEPPLPPEDRLKVESKLLRPGEQYPADSPFVVPLLGQTFLNTKILEPAYLSKPERKALARISSLPEPEIHVVTLRAKEVVPRPEPSGESHHVEWKHRWTVREHIRNQAYGEGRKLRRQVLIREHTKGPEGLEVKQAVYRVTR